MATSLEIYNARRHPSLGRLFPETEKYSMKGCAIPRMALAAAVTWPQNISIGRLGRTALSQAVEDGCWHNNSLVKDDCVSEQEKRGCFGTFWKDPSTLIFDGTMISFINKYLLIVSIKLYVYDCGKWPEPDRYGRRQRTFNSCGQINFPM